MLSGIREYTSGLQVLLLTCGIIFAAARLALAKRGGVAGEAQESFLMLARAVFASMAFAAIITAGTRAGDAFAEWVLFDASRGDAHNIVAALAEFDLERNSGLGTGVLLVLFLLGIISMLIQLVMLVLRQALLILVVAAIPLAAAASGTGPGSQAYKRLLSWSLAFVLWKPVGALVYAIAFTVAGRDQKDPQLVLLGLILLVMSVVVLPALIRLVAPAVATLGSGGGASAVLAGGAAGVAMASLGDRSGGRKVSEERTRPAGAGHPTVRRRLAAVVEAVRCPVAAAIAVLPRRVRRVPVAVRTAVRAVAVRGLPGPEPHGRRGPPVRPAGVMVAGRRLVRAWPVLW